MSRRRSPAFRRTARRCRPDRRLQAACADRDRRTPVGLGLVDGLLELGGQPLRPLREQPGPTDEDRVALDEALHTEALDVGEVRDHRQLVVLLSRTGRDRPGDRVLGGVLEGWQQADGRRVSVLGQLPNPAPTYGDSRELGGYVQCRHRDHRGHDDQGGQHVSRSRAPVHRARIGVLESSDDRLRRRSPTSKGTRLATRTRRLRRRERPRRPE